MKLSIVTTVYQSHNYLLEFYQRSKRVLHEIGFSEYEFIFVNDGSPDNSYDVLISLVEDDENIKIINLSRNFGHYKAIMTGLGYASGELVFLIDCDLEEEPEALSIIYEKFISEGCDVVYGVQTTRRDYGISRLFGSLYYVFFNFFTGLNISHNLMVSRLMNKRYVQSLVKHQEREISLAGLWKITGFHQVPISLVKHATSKTTYTLPKKIKVFVDSIVCFSNKPLIYIFYTGLLISIATFTAVLYLIIQKLLFEKPLDGWSSIMISIWGLAGIVILFIGIIGLYISKIFSEVKQRPYTIVKNIIDMSEEKDRNN